MISSFNLRPPGGLTLFSQDSWVASVLWPPEQVGSLVSFIGLQTSAQIPGLWSITADEFMSGLEMLIHIRGNSPQCLSVSCCWVITAVMKGRPGWRAGDWDRLRGQLKGKRAEETSLLSEKKNLWFSSPASSSWYFSPVLLPASLS